MDWNAVFGVLKQEPTTNEGPAKVRVVGQASKDESVQVALRLGAINSSRSRMFESILFRAFVIPVHHKFMTAMNKAGGEYSERTKGKKGHGLGGPDSFNLASVLVTTSTLSDKHALASKTFLGKYAPGSRPAQKVVALFRTEKMHSSQERRLIVNIRDPELEECMVALLIESGLEETLGIKPPGWLETRAQELLQA